MANETGEQLAKPEPIPPDYPSDRVY